MRLDQIAELLRVLGDETRLRIVHALWRGQSRPWAVSELVEVLELPQPTVSRHLAILREAGIIDRRAVGTYRLYELATPQRRLHAAVLGALEAHVVDSPRAAEDAERLERIENDPDPALTTPDSHATNWFPDEDDSMDRLFKALGHPTRRRILDEVGRRPGQTLSRIAAGFEESRAAVTKHIGTLERAGLLHSRRQGRERRLYADAMPVQLIYDRWTDRFTAPLAARVADIKYRAEEERS